MLTDTLHVHIVSFFSFQPQFPMFFKITERLPIFLGLKWHQKFWWPI